MHMPADWKAIPREVLDRYSQKIARLAPKAEKQFYDYGFQRAGAAKWFAYPYILVQVQRSGRIPEEQLESLKRIEKAMDDSFTKATDSLSSFTANASIGEPLYDAAHHILWTQVAIDVKEIGTVRGLVGAILTGEGFVQVACYAKSENFGKYLPIFESVIATAEIRADLVYVAQNSTGKTTKNDTSVNTTVKSEANDARWDTLLIIVSFCIVVGGLFTFLVRTLKKDNDASQNYNKNESGGGTRQSFTNQSTDEEGNNQEQSYRKFEKQAENSSYENYYDMFGLKPGVPLEVLKQKYRDLVTVWHPDRFMGNPRLQQEAEEKLKELNNAYEVLLNLYSKA